MARKSRKNTDVQPEPAYRAAIYIRTALYIRLSVEDNSGRGNSLETQQLILEDYAARHPEMEICGIYTDNGATGTNFDRPDFQRMLGDIEAGKVNCVMVKDLSRLGRNSIDTGFYIEKYFPDHHVRFIAVNDNFDSENRDNLYGGIILPLKNMINEAYSLDIGKKIKAQARQAMKDGDFVGARAPYGYRKDPQNCHKLLVDDEAAAVVRQVFQWAHEQAGLNDIVRRLNTAGVLPPSQYKQAQGIITHENLLGTGAWQTRTVQVILNSEVYTGDLVQGKSKTVDHRQVQADADNLIIARGTHEAIVSRELFEEVASYRRQVAEESKTCSVKPYTPNIFKGKVFCGQCGTNLHRQRNRQKKRDVYRFHCLTNNRVVKGGCAMKSIKEEDLAATVLTTLREELGVLLGNYALIRESDGLLKARRDKVKGEILSLKQAVDKNKRFLRGLYENLIQGILSSDEYFAMKFGYETKIADDLEKATELDAQQKELEAEAARYDDLVLDAELLNAGNELTSALVERLVERITVFPDKRIDVTFRFTNEFAQLEEVLDECVNM